MDILYYFLPGPAKRILNSAVIVAFLVIGSIIVVTSWQIVELVGGLSEVSVVAQIPMTVPWASIPISFALMVALVVLRIRTLLSGRLDDGARTAEIDVGDERPADASGP